MYQQIVSLILIQFSPALSAIFLSMFFKDWSFFRIWNGIYLQTKKYLGLVISIVIPVLIIFSSSVFFSIFGKVYSYTIPTNNFLVIGRFF